MSEIKNNDFCINYERSEIPQELIDECERLQEEDVDSTYFIFDSSITTNLLSRHSSKEDKRELVLTELLSDEKYHIGNEYNFNELPSRFSYYDTETKLTDRYKRYNYVISFIKKIGFVPSESNFGPEFEQSYILVIGGCKFIIRLRPNLFLDIVIDGGKPYSGFFKKSAILNTLGRYCDITGIIRDIKLDQIL